MLCIIQKSNRLSPLIRAVRCRLDGLSALISVGQVYTRAPTVKIAIETLKRADLVDPFIAVAIARLRAHYCTHLAGKYFPSRFTRWETRLSISHRTTRDFFAIDRELFS